MSIGCRRILATWPSARVRVSSRKVASSATPTEPDSVNVVRAWAPPDVGPMLGSVSPGGRCCGVTAGTTSPEHWSLERCGCSSTRTLRRPRHMNPSHQNRARVEHGSRRSRAEVAQGRYPLPCRRPSTRWGSRRMRGGLAGGLNLPGGGDCRQQEAPRETEGTPEGRLPRLLGSHGPDGTRTRDLPGLKLGALPDCATGPMARAIVAGCHWPTPLIPDITSCA